MLACTKYCTCDFLCPSYEFFSCDCDVLHSSDETQYPASISIINGHRTGPDDKPRQTLEPSSIFTCGPMQRPARPAGCPHHRVILLSCSRCEAQEKHETRPALNFGSRLQGVLRQGSALTLAVKLIRRLANGSKFQEHYVIATNALDILMSTDSFCNTSYSGDTRRIMLEEFS